MKIVHFDEIFHPDFGYQINLVAKFQSKLGNDVTIITGDTKLVHPVFQTFADNSNMNEKDKYYTDNTGVKIIRIPVKRYFSSRTIFDVNIINVVNDLNPDILFCHFNDTLSGIIFTLNHKKLNCPIVFDTHMLDMASTNKLNKIFRKIYRFFIAPIIIKNKIPVIRTQNDDYVEKRLGIPLSQCPWISVGSDTLLFKPDLEIRRKFREENNIAEDDFIVVYTGKLVSSKGGKLLGEAFFDKFNCKRNILLITVGSEEDDEYGRQVSNLFKKSKNRIIRFPTQRYTDLAKFYQVSDLSVFPKQCSLSFYDAQACGLPVVSEDNNVNVDRLKHNNGFNFRAGEIDDFRAKIEMCANMDKEEFLKIGNNGIKFIIKNYNYEDIAKKYTQILQNEYEKFHLQKGKTNES